MEFLSIALLVTIWTIAEAGFQPQKGNNVCYYGKEFLLSGPVIENKNAFFTSLHWAAERGLTESAKRYIASNRKLVNRKSSTGIAPIHLAACKGSVEMVSLLVNNSADLDSKDPNMMSPLQVAEKHGRTAVAELLRKSGAKSSVFCYFGKEFVMNRPVVDDGRIGLFTPLHWVAERGLTEEAKRILNSNPKLINAVHYTGIAPIHLAACKGHVETVKLLMARGADLSLKDPNHMTPIEIAEKKGNLEVVNLLKKVPKSSCYFGKEFALSHPVPDDGRIGLMTPLHWAAERGLVNRAQAYLDHNPRLINTRDRIGISPLHLAVCKGHMAMTKFLVERGADVNEQGPSHLTPLAIAARRGNLQMVDLLLRSGASKNQWSLTTALHEAARTGHTDVIDHLLQHGANIEGKDLKSWTPLQTAALVGETEVVRFLLSRGASVRATDWRGWTALHFAASTSQVGIAKLLISRGASVRSLTKRKKRPLDLAAAAPNSPARGEMIAFLSKVKD